MTTSDMGVHTASMGGIWQCAVYGFGGVRVVGDELHVNPRLPEDWTELEAPLGWRGQALRMHATKDGVTLCNQGQEAVAVVLCGNKQTVAPGQTVRA